MLRVIEILILPERWRVGGGRAEEDRVFGVGDLCGGEKEGVDPDAVDGTFAILTGRGAHEEPGCGDGDEVGLEVSGREVGVSGCHTFLFAVARGIDQPFQEHVYQAEHDCSEERSGECVHLKTRG